MYASLMKLAALPDETLLYCGHEYTENNLRFAQMVEPGNADISNRLEEVKQNRIQNKPTVPASLKIEKLTNPFLRCEEISVKSHIQQQAGELLNVPVAVFAYLRQWKDRS